MVGSVSPSLLRAFRRRPLVPRNPLVIGGGGRAASVRSAPLNGVLTPVAQASAA